MLDRPNTRDGWIARAAALKIEGRAFVDGAYTPALDGATFARISPIDGKVFAHVADCGAAEIDRAVRAARAARRVANAHLTAGLCDAPFHEFPYGPPEWDLDRRDDMMAEPLKVDSSGMIILSDRPGMGYDLHFDALAKTRVS